MKPDDIVAVTALRALEAQNMERAQSAKEGSQDRLTYESHARKNRKDINDIKRQYE